MKGKLFTSPINLMSNLNSNYKYLTTIVHEGTPIAIGVVGTQNPPLIAYQVMQNDGTWGPQLFLSFPDMDPDLSVATWLDAHQEFKDTLNFKYRTYSDTVLAPIQAVSDEELVYVFRQSKYGTLYMDPFVFDTNSQTLQAQFEVRWQVTGEKYRQGGDADVLSFKDPNGNPFLTPTTELITAKPLAGSEFSVVLAPSGFDAVTCWNILYIDSSQSQHMCLVNFAHSNVHLIDPQKEKISVNENNSITQIEIPGYQKTSLALKSGNLLAPGVGANLVFQSEDRQNGGDQTIRTRTSGFLMVGFVDNSFKAVGCFQFELSSFGRPDFGGQENVVLSMSSAVLDGTIPLQKFPDGLSYTAAYVPGLVSSMAPRIFQSADGFAHLYALKMGEMTNQEMLFDTFKWAWVSKSSAGVPAYSTASMTTSFSAMGQSNPTCTTYDCSTNLRYLSSDPLSPTWINNAVISQPCKSTLFFEETASGNRYVIRRLLNDGTWSDRTQNDSFNKFYQTVVPFDVDGTAYWFVQRNADDKVKVANLTASGTFSFFHDESWGGFYDHILFYKVGGNTYMLGHRSSDKKVFTRKMNSDGTWGSRIEDSKWGHYYQNLLTYRIGDQVFLYGQRTGDDRMFIRELNADGTFSDKKEDQKWGHFYQTTFAYQIGNRTFLFGQRTNDNKIFSRELFANGSIGEKIEDQSWGGFYNVLIPAYVNGNHYLVGHRSSDHKFFTRPLNPDGTLGDKIADSKWGHYYPSFSVYQSGGSIYLAAQRTDDTIQTRRINPDGTVTDKIEDDKFGHYYSLLIPYYVNAPLAYAPSVFEFGAIENTTNPAQSSGVLERGMTFVQQSGLGSGYNAAVVDELDMEFMDNATVEPVILGYIESAPPVPSVNMTHADKDYESMAQITYSVAQETQNVWSSSENKGVDASLEGSYGAGKAKIETKYSWLQEAELGAGNEETDSTSLPLTGEFDENEKQFIPNNVGTVVAVSMKAKIYALRLKGNSGSLVGYRYVRIPGSEIPEVIGFQLNDDYRKNGDLTTYYKPEEAAQINNAISRIEQSRAAYYTQYNANAFASLPSQNQITQTEILNQYSWDGLTGTFRPIERSFFGRSTEKIGGAFNFLGMIGFSIGSEKLGYGLTAMAGIHVDLNVMKSEESKTTTSLTTAFDPTRLDHGKLQSTQIENYTWNTYYQDPALTSFDHFFNTVVDAQWLAGDDPDAEKLRRMVNARKSIWRIFHLVTDYNPK